MIHLDDERHWLYGAVDPETDEFPHVRLLQTWTTERTMLFLCELETKVPVNHATILVEDATHLKAALDRLVFRFPLCRHGKRNAVERVFREVKRRISTFSNTFDHVRLPTAESWLETFAVWWNQC